MKTNLDLPVPDPYEGVGGSYVMDPLTGRRIQVVAPPDQPQPAIAAAAAVPVAEPVAAPVQTSALDAFSASKKATP